MIRFRNFSAGYGEELWGPSHLDFEVSKVYSIIGPNGIGKSTFLKCISQVKTDYSGKIEIINIENKWNDLKDLSSEQLGNLVSWMPTYLDLSHWKVKDFLMTNYQGKFSFYDRLKPEDEKSLNDISEFLEIESILNQSIETLSDGQKQRVMLAKCLGENSKIVLLDEPVSFIDLPHKYDFMKKLKTLKNKCVIYSSHDIQLSLKFSDYIIFMYNKELYKLTPKEFMGNKFVREWLGESMENINF